MGTLRPKESVPEPVIGPPKEPVHVDTAPAAAAIRSLLSGETMLDSGDREKLQGVLTFLETYTGAEPIETIVRHSSSMGEILMDCSERNVMYPPEIDAANLKLNILQCEYCIKALATELAKSSPDNATLEHLLDMALDVARILEKSHDDTLLLRAIALQVQMENRR